MKAYQSNKVQYMQIWRNWAHQGLRYMDSGERAVRFVAEVLAILGLAAVWSTMGLALIGSLVLAAVVVHTVFWLLNGNFWALVQFSIPRQSGANEMKTLGYLRELQRRAEAEPAIEGLALFGSLSRGTWHEFSDLDVRYIRKPGLLNLFRSVLFVTLERARAFVLSQPLDVFLADSPGFLGKMRQDEWPIFLVKRGVRLKVSYRGNDTICLIRLTGEK